MTYVRNIAHRLSDERSTAFQNCFVRLNLTCVEIYERSLKKKTTHRHHGTRTMVQKEKEINKYVLDFAILLKTRCALFVTCAVCTAKIYQCVCF